ncbi:MAG: response regulator [Deltaproteobacteria bacterium]|nr:response regulator [Deltaproteobacteria bacterium]
MKTWVLIVDDDAITREALAEILTRAGYRVETSDGGGDPGVALSGRSFCVAVVDYHLPGASGLVVARRLKEAQPDCRVLLVSAELPAAAVSPAWTGSVDAFLAKPFSKDAILQEISRLCPDP